MRERGKLRWKRKEKKEEKEVGVRERELCNITGKKYFDQTCLETKGNKEKGRFCVFSIFLSLI